MDIEKLKVEFDDTDEAQLPAAIASAYPAFGPKRREQISRQLAKGRLNQRAKSMVQQLTTVLADANVKVMSVVYGGNGEFTVHVADVDFPADIRAGVVPVGGLD